MSSEVTRWTADAARSAVSFEVKHLGFAAAKGRFTGLEATLETSGETAPVRASGSGSVEVSSVSTGEPGRDDFLTSPDFFDASRFTRIEFTAADISLPAAHQMIVSGSLSWRAVTRPLQLRGRLSNLSQEPDDPRLELHLTGELRRSDYELTFPQAAGTANKLVADRVKLEIELVLVRAAG